MTNKIKQCPQCKQEFNINSFKNDLCYFCYEDTLIKIWEFTSGDYNDIYERKIIKGTGKQLKEYSLEYFEEYDKDEIEDMGSDSIGYEVFYETENEDDELLVKLFTEAINIEDYNEDKDGKIDIDLTEMEGSD